MASSPAGGPDPLRLLHGAAAPLWPQWAGKPRCTISAEPLHPAPGPHVTRIPPPACRPNPLSPARTPPTLRRRCGGRVTATSSPAASGGPRAWGWCPSPAAVPCMHPPTPCATIPQRSHGRAMQGGHSQCVRSAGGGRQCSLSSPSIVAPNPGTLFIGACSGQDGRNCAKAPAADHGLGANGHTRRAGAASAHCVRCVTRRGPPPHWRL